MKLRQLTYVEICQMNRIAWWHRIPIGLTSDGEVIFTPGEVVHGKDGSDYAGVRFGIPSNLKGKSVLDIGAWDGYFSFECERRGASRVTAADTSEENGGHWGGATTGFNFAKNMLSSRATFKAVDIQQVDTFPTYKYDLVLCFGVLYHLENPITGIKNALGAVNAGGSIIFESAGAADSQSHVLESAYNRHGDPTNIYYPSYGFMIDILTRNGFDPNFFYKHDNDRYTIGATKK